MLHHGNESGEVLLLSYLSDGKEKLLTIIDEGRTLHLGTAVDTIIYYFRWDLHVHKPHEFVLHKVRYAHYCIGVSDPSIKPEFPFQLVYPVFLIEKVQVVDGEQLLHPLTVAAELVQLVCCMPQVNVHLFPSWEILGSQIFYGIAIFANEFFVNKKDKTHIWKLETGQSRGIVAAYLTKAREISEMSEIYKYGFHYLVSYVKCCMAMV